ncbi:hypothetical protein CAOG_009398 [Capsaspora owczarzaki ATCC 30864]|uniref:NADH dehydrogenase [ubiquinone] 1 alpha subcomplex subunit 1 n=1 Tax=Capsaspora owczarzaki (strain ATCC 30864) TaxID=595528 RepID=A0A0D2WIV8_CAPO3|nr:hypothetical protein CAOG_009398 [Capsaspora owczarzaki ATCC 30864]
MTWQESIPGLLIVVGMFTATHVGLKAANWLEGKPTRFHMDKFDKEMAERDERITGRQWRQQAQ